jgi:hypothetical protein
LATSDGKYAFFATDTDLYGWNLNKVQNPEATGTINDEPSIHLQGLTGIKSIGYLPKDSIILLGGTNLLKSFYINGTLLNIFSDSIQNLIIGGNIVLNVLDFYTSST